MHIKCLKIIKAILIVYSSFVLLSTYMGLFKPNDRYFTVKNILRNFHVMKSSDCIFVPYLVIIVFICQFSGTVKT